MTIANLFARIGLKTDKQKADSFSKSLNGIKTGLTVATGLAIGFSIAIKKITDEAFNAAVALKQFTSETGASAQELQKWQQIAVQTNSSAEAVASSIKNIALNREKIKLGQGNIPGYQLLGIDPDQDPFDILQDLRRETAGLDNAMKKHVLSMVGVSAEMLQVLELSNEEFDKMASRTFILPQSAIDIMNDAKASTNLLSSAVKWLKAQIAVGLAPEIKKANEAIVEFIRSNKDLIVKGFKVTFTWISKIVRMGANAVKMVDLAVKSTIGWKRALVGLVAGIALMNKGLLMSPIGLITAGILLLLAVLDDFYVYTQGKGQSLFGNLMKKFPEFEKTMFGVFDGIKEFLKLLGLMDAEELEIDKILEKWGLFGDIVKGIGDGIKSIIGFIGDLVSGKAWKKFTESEFIKSITGFFSKDKEKGRDETFGFGTTNYSSPEVDNRRYNSTGGTTNNNSDVRITNNISSNGDPETVANLMDRRLQRQLNSASTQRIRNE